MGLHGYQNIRNFVGIPKIISRFMKKRLKRVIDKKRIIFGHFHFLVKFFVNIFFQVHFVTKLCLVFRNLHKITNFLYP